MTILDDIVAHKKQTVEQLYKQSSIAYFKEDIEKNDFKYYCFESAIKKQGLSLIAEVKKASPSKGVIRADFQPLSLAKQFYDNGASALSVLTDVKYFQGANAYLSDIKKQVPLATLRKDFIIDEIQVYESKAIGADAILLILSILTPEQAQHLLTVAKSLGLAALIEVHSEDDIQLLMQLSGCQLIGVNNRNLNTFEVNLNNAPRFKQRINEAFPDALFIAESGYSKIDELEDLKRQEINGVLIGEGLALNEACIRYFKHES